MDTSRRRFLRLSGLSALVASVGCLQSGSSEQTPNDASEATPRATTATATATSTPTATARRDDAETSSPTPEPTPEPTTAPSTSSAKTRSFSVQNEWGAKSQMELRWEADSVVLVCGDTNPDPGDVSGNAVDADLSLASEAFDFSNVEEVQYVYRHSSKPGTGVGQYAADEDVSYFAITKEAWEITEKSIRNEHDPQKPDNPNIDASLYVEDEEDTGRVQKRFDTSNVSGSRHVGMGANVGSDDPQVVELDVFDVRGLDRNGDELFHLDPPNELLRFS